MLSETWNSAWWLSTTVLAAVDGRHMTQEWQGLALNKERSVKLTVRTMLGLALSSIVFPDVSLEQPILPLDICSDSACVLNPDSSVCSRPTNLRHRILWEDLGQERDLRFYLLILNAQQRKVSHMQGIN